MKLTFMGWTSLVLFALLLIASSGWYCSAKIKPADPAFAHKADSLAKVIVSKDSLIAALQAKADAKDSAIVPVMISRDSAIEKAEDAAKAVDYWTRKYWKEIGKTAIFAIESRPEDTAFLKSHTPYSVQSNWEQAIIVAPNITDSLPECACDSLADASSRLSVENKNLIGKVKEGDDLLFQSSLFKDSINQALREKIKALEASNALWKSGYQEMAKNDQKIIKKSKVKFALGAIVGGAIVQAINSAIHSLKK